MIRLHRRQPRRPRQLRLRRGPQLWKQGHTLVGLGIILILAGQFWAALPVVTAIAMIGRGAVLTLQSGPRTSRGDAFIVLNLSIYGMLVCLAIVAQSNGVLQAARARLSLAMLLDHATAIVLIVGLVSSVFYRLSQPG